MVREQAREECKEILLKLAGTGHTAGLNSGAVIFWLKRAFVMLDHEVGRSRVRSSSEPGYRLASAF